MAIETVGFSASQIIPKNSLFRLTFGIPGLQVDPLGRFPGEVAALWNVLPPKAGVFPSTPANVYPSAKSATFDARIHADRTGADVLSAISAIGSDIVTLKRAELLTPAQVAVANTDVGALARDAAAKTEAAKAAADSWWTKITTGLTLSLGSLKWVAIAVVLVVLLVAFSKVER